MFAISTGFSAVVKVESCCVHVILLGMLEVLDVALNTEQNFLILMEVIESTTCAWILTRISFYVEDCVTFHKVLDTTSFLPFYYTSLFSKEDV